MEVKNARYDDTATTRYKYNFKKIDIFSVDSLKVFRDDSDVAIVGQFGRRQKEVPMKVLLVPGHLLESKDLSGSIAALVADQGCEMAASLDDLLVAKAMGFSTSDAAEKARIVAKISKLLATQPVLFETVGGQLGLRHFLVGDGTTVTDIGAGFRYFPDGRKEQWSPAHATPAAFYQAA